LQSEDALIAQLRELIETQLPHARSLTPIGDDGAAWQPSRSHRSVVTTDACIEGVHFRRDTMSLEDAGWRSMASNLSDLAAMGARPVLATVALGIPPGARAQDAVQLYRGIVEVSRLHRCAIAGGDVTRAPVWTVCIAAVGEVRTTHLKGRAHARPGDVLALTGALGASRAGLHLADNVNVLSGSLREEALRAHRRPQPRVAEGRFLAASRNVHAMMDVSDGLSTDVARLCARSRCGALVEQVPVAPSAAAMAQARGEDAQSYALAGGEEYELLAAIDARAFPYLRARFQKRFGRPLLPIGHVREGSGVMVRKAAGEEVLPATGWDHLRE